MTLATELLAKGFARCRPEILAPLLSGPLSLLGGAGAPFYALTRPLRERRHAPRRAELLLILRERAPAGRESLAQLFTALRLSRLTLARAARPLTHLAALPADATVAALRALPTGHTRIALLDENRRPDGRVISVKAALGRSPGEPLAPFAQPVLRLPENLPLSEAIERLRAGGQEFVLLTRGAAISGFTTQYDCARLLLREIPRE
jgi:CBS domain containing-hemolysin-like protein